MSGSKEYLPAALLLVFSVGWAGALMALPREGQPVAAIYPPSAGDAAFAGVVNAGADAVLGFGALPGIVVARSDRADFINKLYDSGALVVVRSPAQADCLR